MRHLGHLLIILVTDDYCKGAVVATDTYGDVLVYATVYRLGYIGLGSHGIAATQVDLQRWQVDGNVRGGMFISGCRLVGLSVYFHLGTRHG